GDDGHGLRNFSPHPGNGGKRSGPRPDAGHTGHGADWYLPAGTDCQAGFYADAQREPGNEYLLDGAAIGRSDRKRWPTQWNSPRQRTIGTAGAEGASQGVLLSRGEYAMSTWSLRAA